MTFSMTFLCLAVAFEKFQYNPLQTFRKRQLNEGIFLHNSVQQTKNLFNDMSLPYFSCFDIFSD